MPASELLTDTELEVRNPLGRFGAWVADMLVTNGIGVAALVIPWLIMATALKIMGVKVISMRRQIVSCACVAVWGSVTLGFLLANFSNNFYAVAGGSFGFYAAKWLRCIIGPVGTFCLLAFVLFAYVCVKVAPVREKVEELLRRVHINIPSFQFSTDEGETYDNSDEEAEPKSTGNINENVVDARAGDEKPSNNVQATKESDTATTVTDDGLTIERPKEEETIEVPSSANPSSQSDNNLGLEIVNKDGEETVDKIHNTIDTKYDPTSDLSHYKLPPIELLKDDYENVAQSQEELIENKNKIVNALNNFQIKIESIKATVGPTVTLYDIVPAPGVRIAKIKSISDDIALSVKAQGVRIVMGIGTIGIEVPNSQPQVVSMSSVIRSKKFQESNYELPVALGKTISNETLVFDLAKTPHLLVAGATGQGKSVGLNAIITSLLYKKHPSQIKFVMVDPKMVEFSIYKRLEKFFLAKVEGEDDAIITDVDKVKNTLLSLTDEMDNRYKLLEDANVRQIKEYNKKFIDRLLNPEKGHRYLPYIVVIIDEFADLIMQAGKEVELPIARIAQKARAVGIHMILATQRPSTNIITGIIKAQFPSRIAFKVASRIDSGTILDQPGAQNLIGRGDLLFNMSGSIASERVQCAFVDTPEVEAVTNFISSQLIGTEITLLTADKIGYP